MTQAAARHIDAPLLLPDVLAACRLGLDAAERLVDAVRKSVAVRADGRDGLDREQYAAHGLAWYATYAAALRQTLAWGERLQASGRLG
ncbi:MAG TPA: acyl-CoA dehydrogenase, partial [Kiloniellales bacterium]